MNLCLHKASVIKWNEAMTAPLCSGYSSPSSQPAARDRRAAEHPSFVLLQQAAPGSITTSTRLHHHFHRWLPEPLPPTTIAPHLLPPLALPSHLTAPDFCRQPAGIHKQGAGTSRWQGTHRGGFCGVGLLVAVIASWLRFAPQGA